jgi:hypothetical protein
LNIHIHERKGGFIMKRCLIILFAAVFVSTLAYAAGPKEYQWTGVVIELKDDVIVVEKGKEKWEIGRDKDTKVTGGDLKVGSKVTVYYTMKAASIEVKTEGKKAEPAKAEPQKAEPKKQ